MKTLSDLRRSAGLSRADMAARMGVSNAQVTRIEVAYPDVMFPTVRRYLDALDVKIRFVGAGFDYESDDIEQDPAREATRKARKADTTRRSSLRA